MKATVYLDPDGTSPDWISVIVSAQTGIVYKHQCAGISCEQREQEGYLVNVGGLKYAPDDGEVNTSELTAVFHEGDACNWSLVGKNVSNDRLTKLIQVVANIPFWNNEDRLVLSLDQSQLVEIAEAWVPVITPVGSGILVWPNCD